MQALLEGIYFGVGSGLGALLGGYFYDYFGAVKLFEASAVLSFISMILAFITAFYHGNSNSNSNSCSSNSNSNSNGNHHASEVVNHRGYEQIITSSDIEIVDRN